MHSYLIKFLYIYLVFKWVEVNNKILNLFKNGH